MVVVASKKKQKVNERVKKKRNEIMGNQNDHKSNILNGQ